MRTAPTVRSEDQVWAPTDQTPQPRPGLVRIGVGCLAAAVGLAVVLAVVVATTDATASDAATDVLWSTSMLLSAAAIAFGVLGRRPASRAWWLVVAGTTLTGVTGLAEGVLPRSSWSVATVPVAASGYLVAFTLLLIGIAKVGTDGRAGPGRRGARLDAALLAAVSMFLVGFLVVEPALHGRSPSPDQIVSGVYLLASVAVAAGAFTTLGRAAARTRSGRLVFASAAALVIGNAVALLELLGGEQRASLIPFTTAGVLVAAAALDRSVTRIGGADFPARPLRTTTFLGYGLALVGPPLLIALVQTTSGRRDSWFAVELVAYTLVTGLLVFARVQVLLEEAQRTDERYRQYFATPAVGLAVMGTDRRLIDVNDRLCELMGIERDRLVGARVADITHPDDLARDVEAFGRMLRRETDGYTIEKRYVRPDGSWWYAAVSVRAVRTPAGSLDYALGVIDDITDRKLAEDRLAEHLVLQDKVTGIVERFVGVDELELGHAIDRALTELVLALGADAAIILEIDSEQITATHEWARPDLPRYGALIDRLPLADYLTTLEHLRVHRVLVVDEARGFPDGFTAEEALRLRMPGFPASITVPLLVRGDHLLGALTISSREDALQWSEETVDLVRTVAGAIGQAIDRGRIGTRLSATEARYRSVVEAASDAILTVGGGGVVGTFSGAAENMFGYQADQMVGRSAIELVAPTERDLVVDRLREWVGEHSVIDRASLTFTARRKDGFEFPAELTIGRMELPEGARYTVVIRDVSEHKALEDELLDRATHDPLTGLANRHLFLQELSRVLSTADRRGRSPAVIYVDLDRFKVINDSLGHAVGDRLLEVIADRIRSTVRGSDVAARLGGDEFSVIARDASSLEAWALAGRLLDAIGQPVDLGDATVVVTASIGIVIGGPTSTAEDMLRDADASMYRAKETGRNRIVEFSQEVRDEALSRLIVESELRDALARGELVLHYQPQVDVDDLGIQGVEALLRWQHPTRGLLLPGAFIDVAEETRLGLLIDRWVLAEGIRQAGAWASQGLPISVWINLSPALLADPSLPRLVSETLAEHGVPPSRFGIEVTERSLLGDLDKAARGIAALRDAGVRAAIDDFGTGLSSLTWIQRLQIDTLKIDRSFVAGLTSNDDDAAIVAAVISLAHSLGMTALAEGVETDEQLAVLRGLGCDELQGFLVSPAVVPTEIEQRWASARGAPPGPLGSPAHPARRPATVRSGC
ncbi:MAG: EAL domain-containing protein [Acidimicrobiales bacterium]